MLDKAGNDADQADLLIMMLKAAGYSAQFVTGQMYIPYSSTDGNDLSGWLAVPSSWSAYERLVNGGIPVGNLSGGNLDLFRVWVSVTVGGTPYELDPAFKLHDDISPADISTLAGYSRADLLTAAGGAVGSDYVQGVNVSTVYDYLTQLSSNFVDNLRNSYPNSPVENITGGSSIIKEAITSLASNIIFSTSDKTYTDDLLTETYGHPFFLEYESIGYTGYLHEVALDGLTLQFSNSSNGVQTTTFNESESVPLIEPDNSIPATIVLNLAIGTLSAGAVSNGVDSYSIDMDIVYTRAPYNQLERILTRPDWTYNDSVAFLSNQQYAYSNQSSDDGNYYNLKIRLDGLNKTAGSVAASIKYTYSINGGGTGEQNYDLTGEIKDVPFSDLGIFNKGSTNQVIELWTRPGSVSNETVALAENDSTAYSDVSDSSKIKIKYDTLLPQNSVGFEFMMPLFLIFQQAFLENLSFQQAS